MNEVMSTYKEHSVRAYIDQKMMEDLKEYMRWTGMVQSQALRSLIFLGLEVEERRKRMHPEVVESVARRRLRAVAEDDGPYSVAYSG